MIKRKILILFITKLTFNYDTMNTGHVTPNIVIAQLLLQCYCYFICQYYSLSARILHRAPPPRLQVDKNFLTQKIVADPKMRCHQKSFGIWRVTEAILGQKTCFFSKNIFWRKFIINHTIFLIFRYAFYRY